MHAVAGLSGVGHLLVNTRATGSTTRPTTYTCTGIKGAAVGVGCDSRVLGVGVVVVGINSDLDGERERIDKGRHREQETRTD